MKKLLLTTMIGFIATSSAFAGDSFSNHKGMTCVLNLRGFVDKPLFSIDDKGNIVAKSLIMDKKKYKAYTNPDGTCGLWNSETGKKYKPFGYRAGELRGEKQEIPLPYITPM